MHNAYVYSPVVRPLAGTVFGTISYYGYDAMYFNDNAGGGGTAGDWGDALNWWFNSSFSNPAGYIPTTSDDVYIHSILSTTTATTTTARNITFQATSTNAISITVALEAAFKSLSQNLLLGNISAATTTFWGNYTDNLGSTTGQLIRLFNIATTTSRIFGSSTNPTAGEGGRSDWIVIAQGVIVDISTAIYNTATNIFKALNGGSFSPRNTSINSGDPVTPVIVSTLPIAGQIYSKWLPVVSWGSSTTLCEYSYDNWVTTNTATCASGGTDIARPAIAGTPITLSLRGTRAGNITEQNISFTYNNAVAIWTSCGTDLLDEATRPYYYLKDGAVTGDCHFRVNKELRGSETGTGVLTGSVMSDATSTDGYNIILTNITVTGTTTATTTKSGGNGGNISVYDSTTKALIANGTENASGNGGNAGNIIVEDSTTGFLELNGGDVTGSGNGGNGGNATTTNSLGSPVTSTITANGGDADSCGNGGNAGDISLTDSSYGTITNDAGTGQNSGCPLETHPSGTRRAPTTSGIHTSQVSSGTTNNTGPIGNAIRKAFLQGEINQVSLPIQSLKPINLTKLPTFGEDKKGSFSFITAINNFLFAPLPKNITAYPKLTEYLKTLGVSSQQSLFDIKKKPITLSGTANNVAGIYSAYANGLPRRTSEGVFTLNTVLPITTKLTADNKESLLQVLRVPKDTEFTISFIPVSNAKVIGKFLNEDVQFIKVRDKITTTLVSPMKAGQYTFTTNASPLALVIEVLGDQNTQAPVVETRKSWWGKVKGWFGW